MGFTRKARQLLIAAVLFIPLAAFSALSGADRGAGANNSSEASTTITPSSNFTTGSTGILSWHGDNANGTSLNTPTSITDSKGNVWYRRLTLPNPAALGNNNSIESAIYMGWLVNGLTTSDTIVMTYTNANVTAKGWTLTEATPAVSGNPVFARITAVKSSVNTRMPQAKRLLAVSRTSSSTSGTACSSNPIHQSSHRRHVRRWTSRHSG